KAPPPLLFAVKGAPTAAQELPPQDLTTILLVPETFSLNATSRAPPTLAMLGACAFSALLTLSEPSSGFQNPAPSCATLIWMADPLLSDQATVGVLPIFAIVGEAALWLGSAFSGCETGWFHAPSAVPASESQASIATAAGAAMRLIAPHPGAA